MNNRFLNFSLVLARLMQLGYILIGCLFIYMMISSLSEGEIINRFYTNDTDSLFVELIDPDGVLTNPTSLILNAIQALLLMALYITALAFLIKIIKSIKTIHAFRENTSRHFNTIGHIMLACFVISSFELTYVDPGFKFTFSLDLTFILLSFLSYVLAEIFKEGHKLWEENQLTI